MCITTFFFLHVKISPFYKIVEALGRKKEKNADIMKWYLVESSQSAMFKVHETSMNSDPPEHPRSLVRIHVVRYTLFYL
jgi:hypothetical protein